MHRFRSSVAALFLSASVSLAAGCSGSTPQHTTPAPETTTSAVTESPAETTVQTTTAVTTTVDVTETTQEANVTIGAGEEHDDRSLSSVLMKVSGTDGKMKVTRSALKNTSMGEKDTWTIFVYLCGTDLESNGGAATNDVVQMQDGALGEDVKFVIQTGGTSQWRNDIFDSEKSERYVIHNGLSSLVYSDELKNMGDPNTLADFLSWGVKEYPADKMGVILWDHGGGSIYGLCQDEVQDEDTLYLSEINSAFSEVSRNMTDKFEFIGFDACIMETVEMANILASYSRYMYGSQEMMPGTGLDYEALGKYLQRNPGANGAELGKVVADSYYKSCVSLVDDEKICTFSVIDLEKLDDFTIAFNDFAKELYDSSLKTENISSIVRGIINVDNFGGNNYSEGYTNMVDVGGIISACSDYADGSAALEALDNCISYKINGLDHRNTSGLSIFYPLETPDSFELNVLSGISISPYYLSIVDMIAKGYNEEGYTNSALFNEEGDWYNDMDNNENSCNDETYFDYADEENDKRSELITYEVAPNVDEEGSFNFTLDENGLTYASDIGAYVYLFVDDVMLILGETRDIYADWENGYFCDLFDGCWISLPNSEDLLSLYVAKKCDGYTLYTSPVFLNGQRTNLRIRQYDDYTIEVEGAWDGIDENGFSSRRIKKLKEGDKIEPIYYLSDEDLTEISFEEPYEWHENDNLVYTYLPEGYYFYIFAIEDVYGDMAYSNGVIITIDEDGEIRMIEDY